MAARPRVACRQRTNDNKNSMKGTAVPTFEYKADAATSCLTLIPAPVTLEYTHGTAMIGSLVTIEKRIPEYAVTEDADEAWETLPIEQLMKPTPAPMPPKKREMRARVRVRRQR